MRSFHVYMDEAGQAESVKKGFSWPAAFFGFWWALFLGLRLPALGLFVLFIALQGLGYGLGASGTAGVFVSAAISLGAFVWIGSAANSWKRNNYVRKGYRQITQQPIEAKSPDEAIRLAIENAARSGNPVSGDATASYTEEIVETEEGTFQIHSRTFKTRSDAEAYLDLVSRQRR